MRLKKKSLLRRILETYNVEIDSFRDEIDNYREELVDDERVIAAARQNHGFLTSKELCTILGISRLQAIHKLNALYLKGVFRISYDDFGLHSTFILSEYYLKNGPSLHAGSSNSNPRKRFQLQGREPKTSSAALSDAAMIELACRFEGDLTPAIVCVQSKTTLEKAQKRLDELHASGVFDLEVTEQGGLVYRLKDHSAISRLRGKV